MGLMGAGAGLGALKMAYPIAGTVISAMPGKMEKAYRADSKAMGLQSQQLQAGTETGAVKAERARLQGQVNAQQQQQMSAVGRGSVSGASGATNQALGQIATGAGQGMAAGQSQARAQQLGLSSQVRQQYQNNLLTARNMGQQRKDNALKFASSIKGSGKGAADTQNQLDIGTVKSATSALA